MREMKVRTFLFIVVVAAVLLVFLGFSANANSPIITVDGVEYVATKISGPTIHFETPDTNPQTAFTERHVWEGHGSDNLPCEGGIHWIDNKNVLTVSNCLTVVSTSTTVTTVVPTTSTTVETPSTTVPPTTTTTMEDTTTTTEVPSSSTTTMPPSSTTTSEPPQFTTTTVVVTTEPTLPYTGAGETSLLILSAIALIALGTAVIRASHP